MLNSITPRVGSIFHLRGLKPLDLVLLQFFELTFKSSKYNLDYALLHSCYSCYFEVYHLV